MDPGFNRKYVLVSLSPTTDDPKLSRLELAKKVITELEYPFQLQQLINNGDRKKFYQYLYAVVEIQKSIKSRLITGYETHGTRSIKSLQLVFRGILDSSISASSSDAFSSSLYSSSVTSSYSHELLGRNRTSHYELSSEKVYYLRSIVETLNFLGCLGDCIDLYRISRKSAVDARFLWFRLGNWTINDLQNLDCEQFTAKVRIWIQAANICYNSIFPGERQQYELIFDGVRAATNDNCFVAIVEHVAVELNNFANAVSSIASFQKLFAILDLYKALFVILPGIQNMFHSASCTKISHGATKTLNSLPTLVRKLFRSFEDTVQNELSNTPLPGGTVHSLTEYAMEYVTRISLHKDLLTNIIVSPPTKSLGNQADDQFLDAAGGTPLSLHVIWIIISLKINLELKSSHYKDASLRYVFVTNNVNYIINTIAVSPELLEIIGKEYPSKLRTYITQARRDYSSTIWSKVLYCLRDDGLKYNFLLFHGTSRHSVKNRFKTFNTTFEEVCQTQCKAFVQDIPIDCQLDMLILSKLLSTYKSFLEKYGHLQSESFKERYIKYSTEDLQNKIQSLFSEHLIVHNGAKDNVIVT